MKLPPGLNPEDCERPACDDTVSALNAALARIQGKTTAATTKQDSNMEKVECPPTSAQLGRSTWDLLHSMAAWYPDQPTDDDQRSMTSFMSSFARFYPCPWCATDFQENLAKKPVQTSSRKALSVWLCEQHNIVNQKLGKPLFPCNIKSLDERWRKSSDPKCAPNH